MENTVVVFFFKEKHFTENIFINNNIFYMTAAGEARGVSIVANNNFVRNKFDIIFVMVSLKTKTC